MFALQRIIIEAAHTGSSKSGPTKILSQELNSASQHQVTRTLNCICEHLCFISIYFVLPLARCVLRQLFLHFIPYKLMKIFIGTPYFWIAGETCSYLHRRVALCSKTLRVYIVIHQLWPANNSK